MSGDVTIQAMERLTHMPDSDNPAELIAAQRYNDVEFTGGTITGVTISGLASPLPIADGGTGQITANAALNALLPAQSGQSGKALKTNGTNASWSTDTDTGITQLTGDVTAGPGSGSQAATIANNAVTNAKAAQMATLTVKSNITGGTANAADNSLTSIVDASLGSTQGQILYRGASVWSALSAGTIGKMLKTMGASANPAWADQMIAEHEYGAGDASSPTPINTTLTFNAATRLAKIFLCGPGAGSGSGNLRFGGGGGGSGCRNYFVVEGALGGKTITVTGGAGGANGAYNAVTGGAGVFTTPAQIQWDNGWIFQGGTGAPGIGATNAPGAGLISGEGGDGGTTGISGSQPAYVTNYGQFNIGSARGQDAPIRHEYGTWTPSLSFATPGDLSVAYTRQVGEYTLIGDWITVYFNIITSSFTWSTSSGNLVISGLPYTSENSSLVVNTGPLQWTGINLASYTQVFPNLANNASSFNLFASGMGQIIASIQAAQVASGGTVRLHGSISYFVTPGNGSVGGYGGYQGDIGGGAKGGPPGAASTVYAAGAYIHIEEY